MYIELILNLSLLVAISVISGFIAQRWNRDNRTGAIIQGALFGGAAVIGMLHPLVLGPGLIFDGRSVMLSICALFFGPWAAIISVLMTIVCRIWIGGGGMPMGVLVILSSSGLGLLAHYRWRPQENPPSTWMLYMLGLAVHLVMLALTFTLPDETAMSVLKNIGLPVIILYPLAMILVGKILSDQVSSIRSMQKLQASERKYKELVENANSIILRWNSSGKITFMNEYALNFFGYSLDEIIGQDVVGTIVPLSDSTGKDLSQIILDIVAHPERYKNNENENMRKDGSRAWVTWTNKPLFDEEGLCSEVLCVGNDMTERRRAEEAARQGDKFSKTLIDSIPGTFYMLDEKGLYVGWNAYQRDEIVGKPEELIAGTAAIDTIHPDDRELIHRRIGNVLANGAIETVEGRVLLRGGPEFRWLLMTGRRLMIDGHPFLVGIGIDITESKLAEEALHRSHDMIVKLTAQVPGVVYQYRLYADGRSCFPFASRGMDDIYEVTPEEVREDATPVFGRLHPGDRDGIVSAIQESARTLQPFHYEFRVVLPRQGLRWRLSSAMPERMEDGGTLWYGIISDITERKLIEEEKARLESQLRQAQKMEAVGQLAGGVAHDFNNMLSVINGYSDMLLMEMSQTDPKYDRVREIHKAGLRSAELTQQLLAFARKQTIAPRILDLNDTIAGMLKMLQRLIGENIELLWKPHANIWKVKMDPSQINQILANLLVNARDAISGAGMIEIETGKADLDKAFCESHPDFVPGKYAVLEVSDNGCGMGKETIDHIFEPFFTTKKIGEGTGLGLATIFGIVKQNNGFINVYSEPGKGTAFKIYLPRHEQENGNAGNDKELEPVKMFTGIETVLLVEDEKALLQFAGRLLERLGYTVLPAESPLQAMRIAAEHKGDIHLLMTDVVMPGMSGRDLKEKISLIRPGIRCLFMSGYTADIIAHDGILEEGVHFLEKPFTAEELSAKLREALS
ncbi:MAG TPA: PAS domain-containing sensor histidine kinase [Lentisphaeria bacterium]|nr:MAG: hypothetical protein A2X45_03890 [Lentisphaerae bacterium GWF2_50_93]HCE42977.1 PAS domain-containing sensor histidine kinase [Lentisphaeria bacterium]